MYGHQLRGVESSTAVKGDEAPHLRSLFADPCEPTRATSHEIHMHPKMHGLRGPEGLSEGSCGLSTNEAPPRNPPRTPLSCVRGARRGRLCPFRISRAHRADVPRERDAPTTKVFCSTTPREGCCSRRRPRCVPPSCAQSFREDCSSLVRLKRALLPRCTGLSPKGSDALQQ
jgi:hypothetical protein